MAYYGWKKSGGWGRVPDPKGDWVFPAAGLLLLAVMYLKDNPDVLRKIGLILICILAVVALVIVAIIAVPKFTEKSRRKRIKKYEQQLRNGEMWLCKYCNRVNPGKRHLCTCGNAKEDASAEECTVWKCENCGAENLPRNKVCACGHSKEWSMKQKREWK